MHGLCRFLISVMTMMTQQEELADINSLHLFTSSGWAMLGNSAKYVFQKSLVSTGPVYVFKGPMVDKYGCVFPSVGRWQAFYDARGEFSWVVTVIDATARGYVRPTKSGPMESTRAADGADRARMGGRVPGASMTFTQAF
jgi:hypothetical protein